MGQADFEACRTGPISHLLPPAAGAVVTPLTQSNAAPGPCPRKHPASVKWARHSGEWRTLTSRPPGPRHGDCRGRTLTKHGPAKGLSNPRVDCLDGQSYQV